MNVSIQNCVGDLIVGVLGDAGLGDGGGLRNWGVNSFVGDLVTAGITLTLWSLR